MRVRMMIRAMLVVAATAMILVALTACGGGSAQEESNKPRPLPEDEKALDPGEYRSEEFQPSFSFKVGKGWGHHSVFEQDSEEEVLPEASDSLFLGRGEYARLVFTNVQQVYKPSTLEAVDAPQGDMVGWFQRHPYLKTDKPVPVTVGGVEGVQFDVVVEDLPKDHNDLCGSECVDLFRTSTNPEHSLFDIESARVIVLEGVQGHTVTIYYSSPNEVIDFDEFAPEAQKVIDTVKWTGS